jgi:hypothetical protein
LQVRRREVAQRRQDHAAPDPEHRVLGRDAAPALLAYGGDLVGAATVAADVDRVADAGETDVGVGDGLGGEAGGHQLAAPVATGT